jgi:hypothetical protein
MGPWTETSDGVITGHLGSRRESCMMRPKSGHLYRQCGFERRSASHQQTHGLHAQNSGPQIPLLPHTFKTKEEKIKNDLALLFIA